MNRSCGFKKEQREFAMAMLSQPAWVSSQRCIERERNCWVPQDKESRSPGIEHDYGPWDGWSGSLSKDSWNQPETETDRVKKTQELEAGANVKKSYMGEKISLAIRKEIDRSWDWPLFYLTLRIYESDNRRGQGGTTLFIDRKLGIAKVSISAIYPLFPAPRKNYDLTFIYSIWTVQNRPWKSITPEALCTLSLRNR